MAATRAVERLDPDGTDDPAPAIALFPFHCGGLTVCRIGKALLAALAEWLLGLGCVDTAQADLLGFAALWVEAAQSVAVAHTNDIAGEGLLAGQG